MLIECLIKRDGPTKVTLAGFDYVFAPDEHGRKVCEVMSTDHQRHFLALKDYRPVEDGETAAPQVVPEEEPSTGEGEKEGEEEEELLGKADGTPYATESAARMAASKDHGLEPDQVEVVAVEDGFALKVPEAEDSGEETGGEEDSGDEHG